jgi:hypothetical protein
VILLWRLHILLCCRCFKTLTQHQLSGCTCSPSSITDNYEQLQQGAAYILQAVSLAGQQQQQQQQQDAAQISVLFIKLLPTSSHILNTLQHSLVVPGPVPFRVVRQVRCCILLAECLAGCLKVPGLCRKWLQQLTILPEASAKMGYNTLLKGMAGVLVATKQAFARTLYCTGC